jgi:hypothetical protein
MRGTVSKFRGVKVELSDIRGEPREFVVKFAARLLGAVRKLGEGTKVAPRPAVVVVRAGDELEAVGYMPPENDLPQLGQEDYEQRALEEVRGHLEGVRK